MASIVKRETSRGVRYDVRYRLPDGKVRTKTHRTKKEAEAFAATTVVDLNRGDLIDPRMGKLTFAEWWALWWPTTVNLRPSSRARDESYYRSQLEPAFGSVPLTAIDYTAVAEWVAKLSASDLAPATVVKAFQILNKAMVGAVKAKRISSNPCAEVDLPRIERKEMMFLTPDEVITLADAIDPRYRALVLTGAYCGLRWGEMVGLKVNRVDLLHRRIEVAEIATEVRGHIITGPPKTRAGHRTVPMPAIVADALTEHIKTVTGDLLFTGPKGGYLRGSLFRPRIWETATNAANLRGLRLHDLRHTAVALWISANANPKAIASLAGHTSVVTVLDRYGHLLPGHEGAVTDALDAMALAANPAPLATVRAIHAR